MLVPLYGLSPVFLLLYGISDDVFLQRHLPPDPSGSNMRFVLVFLFH